MEWGADEYIPKPFNKTELLNAVEYRPGYDRRHSYRNVYQHIHYAISRARFFILILIL